MPEMTPAVETASAAPVNGASDGLQNKFHLVVLAFQRAKQLQNGARPRVDASGHKFLWVAMREVMAGMISWSVTQKAGEAAPRAPSSRGGGDIGQGW